LNAYASQASNRNSSNNGNNNNDNNLHHRQLLTKPDLVAARRFPRRDSSIWLKCGRGVLDSVIVVSTLALLVWISYLATTDGKTIDGYYDMHQSTLSVVRHLALLSHSQ
jgi:hypothetical protein